MDSLQITLDRAQHLLKPRTDDSHKGTHGHALLIAGTSEKMGAAILAARACLRSGAGLLTVNVPVTERSLIPLSIPEAMTSNRDLPLELSPYTAAGIGCGLGTGINTRRLLMQLWSASLPLVIDADALNELAMDGDLFGNLPANCILTPHPKEFERLFGPQTNREGQEITAVKMAAKYRCCIVLKGHHTFVTNGTQSFHNTSGNSGLAKGGSGDALTGVLTGLLAQGYSPIDASVLGVYLHGLAADIATAHQSKESLLASDVIDCLGQAFSHVHSNNRSI